MLYNKRVALDFLGKACSNLDILRDRNYVVNQDDFSDRFHKIIFAVLQDLALEQDIKSVDGITIDSYLTGLDKQQAIFRQNNGVDFIDNLKVISESASIDYSYKTLKKYSLLRSYKEQGFDVTEILDESIMDLDKQEEQRKNFDKMSLRDIKTHFKLKVLEIENNFKDVNADAYSFKAGENLLSLIERCESAPLWGKSFQSKYLNTIFRGMLGQKYYLQSCGTGGGKSRYAMGNVCNLAVDELYNPTTKKWEKNLNGGESTLFISTELVQEEIQLAMLAFVACVNEETIKNGTGTKDEKDRLRYASKVIERANIYVEFISDFSIDDIENIIEKNIIRHNVGFVFFDYIQLTPMLARHMQKSFGYTLREDQMLANFSSALKNLSNKYDVFMASSTQLNRSYKTDDAPDPTHLRGGMATADKADWGMITIKVNQKELDKIQPILNSGFSDNVPNMAHYIYKNRGGSRVGVVVWTYMNMNVIREEDCFVTDMDYQLIQDIEPTILVDMDKEDK